MEQTRIEEIKRRGELFQQLKEHHTPTFEHSKRVAMYTIKLAEFSGFCQDDLKEIGKAALFHDIGKTQIPLSILNKQVTRTEEENKLGRLHPVFGAELVRSANMGELAEIVCLQHHERYDGSGYPVGISGDDIHPVAQLLSYADSFDAAITRVWNGHQKSEEEIYYDIVRTNEEKYAPCFRDAFEEFYIWKVWNHY